MGSLRQAPRPLFPVRGRENATTIAGHRLLRALDSTNTSWEVAGANGAHCILRVADELPGGETRGGRRASSRRLKARAALEHPNLLRVLGGGDTERGPYTLLELPAARPLSAVIAEDGPLDPLRTVRLLQGVAEALDLANAQGLFHLELSPQNILVENREDGRALLMDFGISPEVSRVRVGLTPDYRSPDELRHLPPEQASNVYSLACVAWACLTGHPPFVRQSPVAVSYAHTSDPPPVLTAERPDLPAHVDKVMEAALAKEPGDRYRSSGAFMRALAAAVGAPSDQAESPAAPPSEAPDRSTPPNGRGAAPKANGRPAPRPPTSAPPFPLQPAREPRRERVRRPPPTTERPKPGSNGAAPARPAPKAAPAPKRRPGQSQRGSRPDRRRPAARRGGPHRHAARDPRRAEARRVAGASRVARAHVPFAAGGRAPAGQRRVASPRGRRLGQDQARRAWCDAGARGRCRRMAAGHPARARAGAPRHGRHRSSRGRVRRRAGSAMPGAPRPTVPSRSWTPAAPPGGGACAPPAPVPARRCVPGSSPVSSAPPPPAWASHRSHSRQAPPWSRPCGAPSAPTARWGPRPGADAASEAPPPRCGAPRAASTARSARSTAG